jgi:hypothetical protein
MSMAANTIAVDSAHTIHFGGCAGLGIPIANGLQSTPSSGSSGGFYARLDPSASGSAQLLYSTYLGGQGTVFTNDTVQGIALDSVGNAYLTGFASSTTFPTTAGAFKNGPTGAFVTKINPSLSGSGSLLYSAILSEPYYGAPAGGAGIAVDASGDAFIVGGAGPGLPLVNAVRGPQEGVFQSLNGGQSWTRQSHGLTDFPIFALAIDASTSPRTLYAGTLTFGSIFRSPDGGLNWSKVFQLPNSSTSNLCFGSASCVWAVAVDPTIPSNVYAGTSAGVYRSTDRGSTWSAFNAGLSSTAVQGVRGLLFDGATLYAAAGDGLHKLDPGASMWTPLSLTADVHNIVIDPGSTPHILYTASERSGAYKSTDGGATWTTMEVPGSVFSSVAVDTTLTPRTLYACDSSGGGSDGGPLYESTDAGQTWFAPLAQPLDDCGPAESGPIFWLDTTTTPAILYALREGVFRSNDGANSWTTLFLAGDVHLGAIALDLRTGTNALPSTVYVATGTFQGPNGGPGPDTFVAELDPTGSKLIFSTYLDGIEGRTEPGWMIGFFGSSPIALDTSGNIYVTGSTASPYFPTVGAYQPNYSSSGLVPGNGIAFLTKLGSQTLPTSSSGSVTTQVGVQTGTLTITLPNINGSTTISEPTLTVTPLSSSQTASFSLSNNLGSYDVSTTASYSGSVTLCFQALTVNDPNTFNYLQLFHIENGTAVDVTSSRDFNTRTVCGTRASLSPFVLFSPTTTTTLASSLNPSVFGQSLTFTATVAASGGTPAGTVTFYDGANTIGTGMLDSSGQATLNVASLSAGTHTITAAYSGGGRLLGSASPGFSETVSKASTSTGLSTSANPSILNQSLMLTATVAAVASATGTPLGTVTFKDGATAIGTATLNANGQATLTISSFGVGSHLITAVYMGDSNFNGSASGPLSQVVQYGPLGTSCLSAAGHQILQPINNDGSSVWKQDRTVPAQFRVCNAKGVSIGTPGVVSSFYLTKKIAGTVTSVDETVSSTTSDTAFHWDATNQQWIFNISTQSLSANYTYVYTITLNDGTSIGFQYGLK